MPQEGRHNFDIRRVSLKSLILGYFTLILACFVCNLVAFSATPPESITYQGKLLSNGVFATGTLPMKFTIHDALSGGNILYAASGTVGTPLDVNVNLNTGLFFIIFGDTGTNAIDSKIFKDNSSLFLQVEVNGEILSPRRKLSSSPYAFNARYLNGLDVTSTPTTSPYIPAADINGNFSFNNITSSEIIANGGIELGGVRRTSWPTGNTYTAGSGLSLVANEFSLNTSTSNFWSSLQTFENINIVSGTITSSAITNLTTANFISNGISQWNNDAGYLTSYTETDPVWMAVSSSYSLVGHNHNSTYAPIVHSHTSTTISGLTVSNFATNTLSQWTNDVGYLFVTGTTGQTIRKGITGWEATSSLFVANTGNIGIGTTNPIYPLHLAINTSTPFYVSGTGTTRIKINDSENSGVTLSVGGINRWSNISYQKNTGNYDFAIHNDQSNNNPLFIDGGLDFVGIGTTSPDYLLTVDGDLNLFGSLRFAGSPGTNGQVLMSRGDGLPAEWVATSTLGFSSGTEGSTSGTIFAGTAGQVPYYAVDGQDLSPASSLYVSPSNGKVGIGTTDPRGTLHIGGGSLPLNISSFGLNVTGDAYFGTSTATNARIKITSNPSFGNIAWNSYNSGSDTRANSTTQSAYQINFSGSGDTLTFERAPATAGIQSFVTLMQINGANGNVGIGTTTAGYKLTVSGDTNITGDIYLNGINYSQYFISSAGNSGDVWVSDGSGTGYWTATSTLGLSGYGNVLGNGVSGQLTFWSDTDTISGSNNLFWNTSTSRLGIGTTTPQYALSVVGDVNVTGTYYINGIDYGRFFINSAGTAGQVWQSDGSNAGAWVNTNTLGYFILPSGTNGQTLRYRSTGVVENTSTLFISDNTNVGIGSTSPSSKLTVAGDLDISGNLKINGNNYSQYFIGSSGNSGELWISDGSGAGYWAPTTSLGISGFGNVSGSGVSGQLTFWTDAYTISGSNNLFWSTSTSRLGIGTSNPQYPLSVVGDVNVTGTYRINGNDYGQYFIDSAGTSGQIWKSDGSGAGTWTNTSSLGYFSLPTGGAGQVLRFKSNGEVEATNTIFISSATYVGIGSTSPSSKLTVGGDINLTGALKINGNDYSQYFIDSAGNDGEIWISDGSGRGYWAPTTSLGISGFGNINGAGVAGRLTYWTDTYNIAETDNLFWATSTSRLGIGTTTPQYSLSVVGDINVTGTYRINNTDYGQYFPYLITSSGTSGQIWKSDGSGAGTWTNTSSLGIMPSGSTGQSMYYTGSAWLATSTIFVSSSGYIGIGTINPTGKLEVESSGYPVINGIRTSNNTDTFLSAMGVTHKTTADMVDGFGAGMTFAIQDNSNVLKSLASIGAVRDGYDLMGKMIFRINNALFGVIETILTSPELYTVNKPV